MLKNKIISKNKLKLIYIAEEDRAFSSIDFVGQCLVDTERTAAFQKTINKVIKKNHTVLDLGTGSGIMALSAAKAGAKKVYAVEFDPFVAKIANKATMLNKFKKKIFMLINDARILHFSKDTKFDIVISEMITTGMVDESQVQVINNLHNKKLVDSSTIFLPLKQDTYISLVNADFTMSGFKIPMILHLWKWHKWSDLKIKNITNQLLLNSIYFNKINKEKFDIILSFQVKKNGIINSLYLTSRTFLTDKDFINDTEALNAPMLVPISEKFVKIGQKVKLKISYTFGSGYRDFNAKFIR